MMFIVFNGVNREYRIRWTSQIIVSVGGLSPGQFYSPSDRVRSGDGANITVDIQRGLSGSLLPASLTRLLDRVSICVGSLLYTRSDSTPFF